MQTKVTGLGSLHDAGLSIYLRLGLEAITRTTRFFHTG
jgi:hypothetical protein